MGCYMYTAARLALLILTGLTLEAAEVQFAVVGAFGEPVAGCSLSEFRGLYKSFSADRVRFRDLWATAPLGSYEVTISCQGREIHKNIEVTGNNQYESIWLDGRKLIADHTKSQLRISMGRDDSSIWWVRLLSLYGSSNYLAHFDNGDGEATITEPFPGSYLIIVFSNKGRACTAEIDFVEFTRSWHVDPDKCLFTLDRFAHLVQQRDKDLGKQTPWYREVRSYDEDRRKALEVAPKLQNNK